MCTKLRLKVKQLRWECQYNARSHHFIYALHLMLLSCQPPKNPWSRDPKPPTTNNRHCQRHNNGHKQLPLGAIQHPHAEDRSQKRSRQKYHRHGSNSLHRRAIGFCLFCNRSAGPRILLRDKVEDLREFSPRPAVRRNLAGGRLTRFIAVSFRDL